MTEKTAKIVTQDELRGYFLAYQQLRDNLGKVIESWRGAGDGNSYVKDYINNPWVHFVLAGRKVIDAVMSSKEIPANQTKVFEMVARTFHGRSRVPNKPIAWWDGNQARFDYLEKVLTWPDKVEGVETAQMFKIGPFTIHNTMGLADKDLEGVKISISQAIHDIQALPIPGIDKVLYGDIFIVAQIRAAKNLAWYDFGKDELFVRPFLNAGFDEVQSLIHELGHRFERKFMTGEMRKEWNTHHTTIPYENKDRIVHLPKVGEPLLLNGKTRMVVTVDDDWITVNDGAMYKVNDVYKALSKRKNLALYPTAYSATDFKEHFCDALALRATNKLTGNHLAKFQEVFEGASPAKVAQRWMFASRLILGPGIKEERATLALQTAKKLPARRGGDVGRESATWQAAYQAKKDKVTMYIYPGNSYMVKVWRVTYRLSDALDPLGNDDFMLYSITPNLEVFRHELSRP